MLCFPNAKINLGLNVVEKREDGFHNIETVFYPIQCFDALEVVENQNLKDDFAFFNYKLKIDCNIEDNLVVKAFKLLKKDFNLPKLEIHLLKNIDFGAGLGGGSADAAFMLTLLNKNFNLNIPKEKLLDYAAQLGSDCSFFIENKSVFASGKGDIFSEINIDLSNFKILLVLPKIHISTKDAYTNIIPQQSNFNLKNLSVSDIYNWKNYLKNDFEEYAFKMEPSLAKIKDILYNNSAIYASMTGSGSAIYGVFKIKELKEELEELEELKEELIFRV
jgi:4-diphosphocytidyl-2-C-methyl-D-erythritol kinase